MIDLPELDREMDELARACAAEDWARAREWAVSVDRRLRALSADAEGIDPAWLADLGRRYAAMMAELISHRLAMASTLSALNRNDVALDRYRDGSGE